MASRLPLALLLLAACAPAPGPTLTFGALLPLTGELADPSADIQRAMEMAGDRINRSGGVAGRQLRIHVQNTYSDTARGLRAAQALAEDASILALLGPQEDDLARGLLPTLKDRRLVALSGGAISSNLSGIDDGDVFFRTCPSAEVVGKALAARLLKDEVRRAAILFVATEQGRSLSGVIENEFRRGGGEVVSPGFGLQSAVALETDQDSYREVLLELQKKAPQALVLLAGPRTGATLVKDWALLGSQGKLYFGPSLRSDVFIDNLPGNLIDGMIGVTAGVNDEQFMVYFASKHHYRPRTEAFFYYDALALLALATESAAIKAGGPPPREKIGEHLRLVSNPPGEKVTWNELERGLTLVRAGTKIDYQGASGSVDLDAAGDVPGDSRFWTVKDRTIELEP